MTGSLARQGIRFGLSARFILMAFAFEVRPACSNRHSLLRCGSLYFKGIRLRRAARLCVVAFD